MAPIVMQDELVNDLNNDNPVVGLKGSLSLKHRFKYRLSRMLGRSVAVVDTEDSQTINIYIAPTRGAITSTTMYDKRIREFSEDLQCAMQDIARFNDESQKEDASHDQWDILLVYVSPNVHKTIMALQQTFKNHREKFDAAVTQICGLDDVDEHGSSLDTDLGDSVIRLHQQANGYDGTMKEQNALIEVAWSLIQQCPALDVRLKCILGSAFSIKVYDLICQLSHPLSTHHTLIRAATTFRVFRRVEIHLGLPPPASPKAISTTSKAAPAAQPLQLCRPVSPARSMTPPQGSMMVSIWQYLPEEDRGIGLLRLQPTSKQAAALLVGCVLHNIPVPPGSETYYAFGFVACRNEEEERELAAYYRQLLETTLDPAMVFKGIIKALEHSTLAGLVRNKGRQDVEKCFPAVHQFLTVHPEKRFSVHRLVQFIRDSDSDNDEPPPCLKRDYGFKFCTQREQVNKLKALYARIIHKSGPGRLHRACTFGRLLDFAITILGSVDKSIRRLLQNDYPNPSIGYDNSQRL